MRRLLLVLAVLGGAMAALTGTAVCNPIICTTATRDAEKGVDSYTLSPVTQPEEFGWIAAGWGELMPFSPLVIMWPNQDGTFTLSQRMATAHKEPKVVADPPRIATLDLEKTYSNGSGTSFTFTVPSDGKDIALMLWSMSRVNPNNAAVDAPLLQHTWHALEVINFAIPFDAAAGPTTSTIGAGHSKAMLLSGKPSFALIAHVVCGALVAMLVLPGGVVVPRITRGLSTNQNWFRFHMINQGLIALGLVIAAFAIALTFGGEIDTTHRKTGTALLSLVILQGLLGCFAHFYVPGPRVRRFTFMTKRGRGPSNFIHVGLGIIVVSVGWSAVWTGLTDEWTRRGHGVPEYGWRVGWGVAIMLWILTYFGGVAYFLPRQLRIESKQRAWELKEQKKFFPSEFDLKNRNEPITPTPPLPQEHLKSVPAPLTLSHHSPKLSFPGSPRSPASPGHSSLSSLSRNSLSAFRTRPVQLPSISSRDHQSKSSRSGTSDFGSNAGDKRDGPFASDLDDPLFSAGFSSAGFARSELSGLQSGAHSQHSYDSNPFSDSSAHNAQQHPYANQDLARDQTFGELKANDSPSRSARAMNRF